jgi:hypothetical protein
MIDNILISIDPGDMEDFLDGINHNDKSKDV